MATPNLALKTAIRENGLLKGYVAASASIDYYRFSRIVNGHLKATEDEEIAIAKVLNRDRADLFVAPETVKP